jgi:hypothetical protein
MNHYFRIDQYGNQYVSIVEGNKIVAFTKEECYEKTIIFLLDKLKEYQWSKIL